MKLDKIKHEILKIENDVPLLHITTDKKETLEPHVLAELKKTLPANTRIVVTGPEIKLNVCRAKSVTLQITSCEASHKEIIDHIDKLLRKRCDTYTIKLTNIKWRRDDE